jgi:hypothetical protein
VVSGGGGEAAEGGVNFMDHGYFIFLTGEGPLKDLPFAWFAYIEDAKAWAVEHSSFGHQCEVRTSAGEVVQARGPYLTATDIKAP